VSTLVSFPCHWPGFEKFKTSQDGLRNSGMILQRVLGKKTEKLFSIIRPGHPHKWWTVPKYKFQLQKYYRQLHGIQGHIACLLFFPLAWKNDFYKSTRNRKRGQWVKKGEFCFHWSLLVHVYSLSNCFLLHFTSCLAIS